LLAPDGLWDEMDRWPRERLERYWVRRVRRVLEVASRELPFYRKRFQEAGFRPEGFRSLADLARVPVFGRRHLLAALREGGYYRIGLERGQEGAVVALSSGTEGDVLFLTYPRRWREMERRATVRAHRWGGLRPNTPVLISAPAWHIYALSQTLLANALGLQVVIIWGTYAPPFARQVLQAMKNFRPRFLSMFLPMAFSLVEEARAQGLSPKEVFKDVGSLMVVGAPITPGMRRHLQELTGVERVVEAAGSSEGLLAVECEVSIGLHVVPEKSVVEVLDPITYEPLPPGRRGAVVITNTWPWGPLYIRYDTGDMGVVYPGSCPCGRPSPRIKVMGRRAHLFRLGDRELLPYDVQEAIEEEVPELTGVTFAILGQGLREGRLHILLRGDGIDRRSTSHLLSQRLAERMGVPVVVEWAPSLPLRWKGVPPILEEGHWQGS